MTTQQPIDLSIIDEKDLKNIKEKKKRIDRVMQVIHENGLEKDKEFMKEITELMEWLLEK